MKLSKYKNLIKSLPVYEQAFSTKHKTWESVIEKGTLKWFFCKNYTLVIS